jgi:hypothetical protein
MNGRYAVRSVSLMARLESVDRRRVKEISLRCNEISYQKISACANSLKGDPDSMQLLRDMVK